MRRLPPLPRRIPLRVPLIAALALALLGGGWMWLRESSLVAVERVEVRGATGPDAPDVESALRDAAERMTTLNVRRDELREAVAHHPTIADVRVRRDLPHGLRIDVVERVPVAVLRGGRVPVAGDGTVLRGATAAPDLPELATRAAAGARLEDPRARRLVALLAAAPAELRRRGRRAYLGERGLTLTMRDGPSLYFGTTADLRAKWAAAARVLADPTAEGARYVDVRVPERPAAGGLTALVRPDEPEQEAPSPST